jgi:hypothetical protein
MCQPVTQLFEMSTGFVISFIDKNMGRRVKQFAQGYTAG